MKIALLYVRQSRHRSNVRTISPENQEAACRALPAVQGCDAVEVYSDLDKSGRSTARRADYLALARRIEGERSPGEVRVVAVYDQKRLGRNKLHALQLWALLETRPWIEVVLVEGGTLDRSNSGELTYAIRAAVAEYEAQEVGRQMRDNLRHAIERGEMVGPVPLGYRRVRDGANVTIEVDPDWAPFIERLFREYATGRWSTRELATRLNAEGIRPPTFEGGVRADTLSQMIASPVYAGMMHKGGRRQTAGELVPGRWPALIDRETWDVVHSILARLRRGGGGGAPKRIYPFQRILRCGDCGCRMYAHTMPSGAYYRCRSTGAEIGCGQSVREDRLIPWGRALMAWLEAAADRSAMRQAVEDDLGRTEIARPADALAQIDGNLERIGLRFEWGEFDEVTYRSKRERLLTLRVEVERSLAAPPEPRLTLTGLVDAWDADDALTRRQLLWALFDELDVRGQAITAGLPRREVEVEVAGYLANWTVAGAPFGLRFAEGSGAVSAAAGKVASL